VTPNATENDEDLSSPIAVESHVVRLLTNPGGKKSGAKRVLRSMNSFAHGFKTHWHPPQAHPNSPGVDLDDGVLGDPRHERWWPPRQTLDKRKADAPRVDEKLAAVLANHLQVCVATSQQRTCFAQVQVEVLGRGGRQQIDRVRAGTAMEDGQHGPVELQIGAVDEAFDLIKIWAAQLIARPVDRLSDLWRLVVAVDQVGLQEVVVVVAPHTQATEAPQPIEHFAWLRAERGDIAETDDRINLLIGDVVEHSVKRHGVAMNVRHQGDSHGVDPIRGRQGSAASIEGRNEALWRHETPRLMDKLA
jgi:hypothetical protein